MTTGSVILDTDILSASMRHDPRVLPHVEAYLKVHDFLSFSVITRFEILLRGLKSKGATTQLTTFRALCATSHVLPLTDEVVDVAADIYAGLHRSGTLITDADILIAATALVSTLPLVTNNTDHFARITGLRLLNWLIEPAQASHIVSDERLGEPRTNRELFDLLAREGFLPGPLAEKIRDMAGFRNVLVHGYDDVDLWVLEDVMENHLGDLPEFTRLIRGRLSA